MPKTTTGVSELTVQLRNLLNVASVVYSHANVSKLANIVFIEDWS